MTSSTRRWQKILEDITYTEIPFEYVYKVYVVLKNNYTYEAKSREELEKFISYVAETQGRNSIRDIQFLLNTRKIKKHAKNKTRQMLERIRIITQ